MPSPLLPPAARELVVVAVAAVAVAAAVASAPYVLSLPDERSYYYGAALWGQGRWEAPAAEVVSWAETPYRSPFTLDNVGPPAQFVPTASGGVTTEKAPGFLLWLVPAVRGGFLRFANALLCVGVAPVSFWLLRRVLGEGALWASLLFLVSPFVVLFLYQPLMPTFFDAALFWLVFALVGNVAAGGRAAVLKSAGAGIVAAALGLSRVVYWPAAVVFAAVVVGSPPRSGRAFRGIAFALPLLAGIAFSLFYNYSLWGSPLKSGYYVNFTVNNPNAVSSLWEPRWRQVPPVSETRPLPRPRVVTAGCEARWAWEIGEDTILSFPAASNEPGVFSLRWAAAPSFPGDGPKGPVKVLVFFGETCVYDYGAEPGATWNVVKKDIGPGTPVRLAIEVPGGGRGAAYVTPPELVAADGHYRFTNWMRPSTSLWQATARNFIAILPYLLFCLPALALTPAGFVEGRRALPPLFNVAVAAILLGTIIVYLQSRIYVPGGVWYVTRFYAPAVAPAALWGGLALRAAGGRARWLTVGLSAAAAAAAFVHLLVNIGALSWPAFATSGGDNFFR